MRCGVDASLVPGTKAAVPTVLYFGRLKAYKRVDRLIEAFAGVRAEDAVGAAADCRHRRRAPGAARTGAPIEASQDAVSSRGSSTTTESASLLQRAWVTASLSEIEGWGISVIEGNACGTPAIVYDVPGLREAIVHQESGLILPEGGDVAAAILAVLQDDVLRRASGTRRAATGRRSFRGTQRRARCFSNHAGDCRTGVSGGRSRIGGGRFSALTEPSMHRACSIRRRCETERIRCSETRSRDRALGARLCFVAGLRRVVGVASVRQRGAERAPAGTVGAPRSRAFERDPNARPGRRCTSR